MQEVSDFFRNGMMLSAAAKGQPLSFQSGYLNFSTSYMKNVLLQQKLINA